MPDSQRRRLTRLKSERGSERHDRRWAISQICWLNHFPRTPRDRLPIRRFSKLHIVPLRARIPPRVPLSGRSQGVAPARRAALSPRGPLAARRGSGRAVRGGRRMRGAGRADAWNGAGGRARHSAPLATGRQWCRDRIHCSQIRPSNVCLARKLMKKR